MTVPHPGGDPNVHLYEQLKRDVLERAPHITTVEYLPDEIESKRLRATFDPARLDSSAGPELPFLTVRWYRQTPHDWFRADYSDPNSGFHAGWRQDEDRPDLGPAHFQWSVDEDTTRRGVTFDHETSSLLLWEILEELLEEVLPTYQ